MYRGELDRLFLYDLDALESIAEQNLAQRRKEMPKVEGIIVEEVEKFLAWYESLDMVPVIRALRGRFHEIAQKELDRQVKNFDSADREALQEYTRALLNKLLPQPTTRIRGVEASSGHGIHKLVAIQELFELDLQAFKEEGRTKKKAESGKSSGDSGDVEDGGGKVSGSSETEGSGEGEEPGPGGGS